MENITAENLRMLIKIQFGKRVLDLSGKSLSKVPAAQWELTELEELHLSNNYLKELPASINKLRNLRWLSLDGNQLRELPHSICELSNLTVLSVDNNQLSVLPSNIKHLKNLRVLYLDNNQFTTFPDGIGELKGLRLLSVAGNPLTLEEMRKVVKLQNKIGFLTDVKGKDMKYSLFVFMLCIVNEITNVLLYDLLVYLLEEVYLTGFAKRYLQNLTCH